MNKNLIYLVLIAILLNSCSTLREGFESQRKNSTDEFLVEKKQPLVMPPDYNDLPLPVSKKNGDNTDNFQKLIDNKEINNSKRNIESSSQKKTENFILEKIKDN